MTKTQVTLTRQALKTPRSAAIAGIIFAVLYGASMVLLNISLSEEATGGIARTVSDVQTVALALNLIPYAGIAFLWFIGVIRDLLSDNEDRLFATVFLGSGLLFLALTFIGAALAAGLLSAYTSESGVLMLSGVSIDSRSVIYHVFNIYAIRMSGVFMISLATIWLRTGVMRRGWAYLTYVLALILLLSIDYSYWVTLILPGWVLVVSVYILIRNLHNQPRNSDSAEIELPPGFVALDPAVASTARLTVRIVATDLEGNQTIIDRDVQVVSDESPPQVEFVRPDLGRDVIEGTPVRIQLLASDNVLVDRVRIWAGKPGQALEIAFVAGGFPARNAFSASSAVSAGANTSG